MTTAVIVAAAIIHFLNWFLTARLSTAAAKHGISLIEAVYRWLGYHSMLRADRGDAVIIGASKIGHLRQNMAAMENGPLPEDVVTAFEEAWRISRPDSPEYFTLYKGKGSVGGEKK